MTWACLGYVQGLANIFGHFLPKNDQMTQNNALYSNKQNVPGAHVKNLIYQ